MVVETVETVEPEIIWPEMGGGGGGGGQKDPTRLANGGTGGSGMSSFGISHYGSLYLNSTNLLN